MRPIPRGLPALAAVLCLCSCVTEDEVPWFGGTEPPLSPADREIAAALYAGTPRTPAGFAADPAPASFAQVTTSHIKTSQLAAPAATQHEVCTDDWNVALAWAEEVAVQAVPYLDLVATEATARYFEFGRVPRGDASRYVRLRVLKCASLDRTGVELPLAAGFAGTLNARPLDAAALRELGEYLWLFTSYNNSGHAVVASEARGPGLTHAVTIASLERAAGEATCDRVTLRDWTHTAAEGTGVLTLGVAVVREFGVRQDGGALVGC
jgi:hypothetical protein